MELWVVDVRFVEQDHANRATLFLNNALAGAYDATECGCVGRQEETGNWRAG